MHTELPARADQGSAAAAPPAGPPDPSAQPPAGTAAPVRPPLAISKKRLALALAIAAASDAVGLLTAPALPVVWAADVATAFLLFVALGWQWLLLPGLVLEAIPGVGVAPVWVLVVVAVALWGTARPNLKRLRNRGE
jgi:hypothetical protein